MELICILVVVTLLLYSLLLCQYDPGDVGEALNRTHSTDDEFLDELSEDIRPEVASKFGESWHTWADVNWMRYG